MMVRNR
jgi:hypothetical protein